jgi:succinate dehydrogenase / fumarate reductase, cytochrome b subunit
MNNRSNWFEPEFRSTGKLAFMLHRLSGLGLVAYLYLHLVLLNTLRQGPQAWDAFVQLMRSPLVLFLDAILLFGILIHGLNGLRLVLVGYGAFLRWQRLLFWLGLVLAIALTIWGMLAMR